MGRPDNKVAIVTGVSHGQGAEICRAFVAEGAKVAVADIVNHGASKIPLRRVGPPIDIAPLHVYLASDESTYVKGAEIAICGGVTATHAFGG